MSTTTAPTAEIPAPVQLGLIAWLVASFVVMFVLGNYEPGVGASGPGAGIGLGMLGVYFLACSTVFRGFFLYRLKVLRITNFWGEDSEGFAHGMYGSFGVGALVLAPFILMR